jgi:hypothetical protein
MGERSKNEQERVKAAIEEAKAKAELLEQEIENTQDTEKRDELTDKLEQINEEIHSLNSFLQEVWGDGDSKEIVDELDQSNDLLERVDNTLDDQLDQQQQSDRRDDLLERESQLEGRGAGGFVDDIEADDMDLDSLSGPMKLLSGLKMAAIGGILYSIYNFIDGIFGVADFLGKDQSDVTIKERIIYGVANVISTLGHTLAKPIDWIYQWLTGNDSLLGDKDDLTRFFYDGITWIVDTVTDFIKSPIDFVKNLFDRGIENLVGFLPEEWGAMFGEDIKSIAGKVFDFFTLPLRMVQGILSEAFEFIQDPAGYAQAVKDKVSASIESGIQFVQDTIDSVMNKAREILDNIKNAISDMTDQAMKKLKGFFGLGDDEEKNESEIDRIEKVAREYEKEDIDQATRDLRARNASELSSSIMNRDAYGNPNAIPAGVVKNPNGSPMVFNQTTQNMVNNTTVTNTPSVYNSDPAMRRRLEEAQRLRYGSGW